jgi:hypothetical protein
MNAVNNIFVNTKKRCYNFIEQTIEPRFWIFFY